MRTNQHETVSRERPIAARESCAVPTTSIPMRTSGKRSPTKRKSRLSVNRARHSKKSLSWRTPAGSPRKESSTRNVARKADENLHTRERLPRPPFRRPPPGTTRKLAAGCLDQRGRHEQRPTKRAPLTLQPSNLNLQSSNLNHQTPRATLPTRR